MRPNTASYSKLVLKRALDAVAAERIRQIEREGFAPADDDAQDRGQLALAAISHVFMADAQAFRDIDESRYLSSADMADEYWPFTGAAPAGKAVRRHLVIAAALLVAEIERLDRAAARSHDHG